MSCMWSISLSRLSLSPLTRLSLFFRIVIVSLLRNSFRWKARMESNILYANAITSNDSILSVQSATMRFGRATSLLAVSSSSNIKHLPFHLINVLKPALNWKFQAKSTMSSISRVPSVRPCSVRRTPTTSTRETCIATSTTRPGSQPSVLDAPALFSSNLLKLIAI